VKPEPDGRFRISGVEPGAYDFAVNLYGTTEGCLVHPISMGVAHFTVKPGETHVDLGKVTIPSVTLPKIGDVAADFEYTATEGAKSRLTSLRGSYVLIDFWATWCAPCVAKLDSVEHLRHQFVGDHPLVVVGANLDADTAQARAFLKSKPLPWQHAFLGDWANTDVPRRYAISAIPAYVLIGPDGRILAQEYAIEGIASKLKSICEKPNIPVSKVQEPRARKSPRPTQVTIAESGPPKPSKEISVAPKAAEGPELRSKGLMRVHVFDDTGKPLPDAAVRVQVTTVDGLGRNTGPTTERSRTTLNYSCFGRSKSAVS
jgi:thiol-disulfide isomerase/thioredoxin